MPSRCNLPALLSALSLVTACAPSAPCREPVSVSVPPTQVTPSTAPTTAVPAEVIAPARHHLMSIYNLGEDDGTPHQSFLLSGNRASMPYYVPREAAELVRSFSRREIPPQQREPYDAWARRTLANGGAFVRAELTMTGNQLQEEFVVLRGGRAETVEAPKDMLLPIAVLYDVPIYVDIAYIKEIGGWRPAL